MDDSGGMNKDRLYMLLAFLAFVILGIIAYNNYNHDADGKIYDANDVYDPGTYTWKKQSSESLWAQMAGNRAKNCPVTELSLSDNGIIFIEGGNAWNVSCMFLAYDDIEGGTRTNQNPMRIWHKNGKYTNQIPSSNNTEAGTSNPDKNGLVEILHIPETTYGSMDMATAPELTEASIPAMFDMKEDHPYYELIAPFNFSFGNQNVGSQLDNGHESIVITNTTGDVRVTFNNVINWACAGPMPEQTDTEYETKLATWLRHGKYNSTMVQEYKNNADEDASSSIEFTADDYHHTIFGNTNNGKVQGGAAGDVVGYGDGTTTITIEYYNKSKASWESLQLHQFLMWNYR